MKLPVVLQTIGLTVTPVGMLLLFGAGWAILTAGLSVTAAGVALELERRG